MNVGNTRIRGFEISLAGEGNAGSMPLTIVAGYTYMHPVDLDMKDSISSGTGSILKYRHKHSVKADAELQYRTFTFGITAVANSRMENIDEVFLDPLYGNFILPGFPDYWDENNREVFVAHARCIYQLTSYMKIGLVAKNIMNREYLGRPGDIQAPRNITLRLSFDL